MQREEAREAEAAPPPAQAPVASEAAALNAKAEAAAAQPLPDSDDSEDEALGVVRSNLRTGGPRENGNATGKAQPQVGCGTEPQSPACEVRLCAPFAGSCSQCMLQQAQSHTGECYLQEMLADDCFCT